MIIKRVKLENIRSYLSQEVSFPRGSVLLSGDIGSGKSSILLAIDFALFGLQQSNLSGSSLLRNGKTKGSVEVQFDVNGKNIIVGRNLKRTKESVNQDSGYIITDNKRADLSAVEIKQKVLELLNYPSELLTKNKALIYRYTVYTPQEEMKHILLSDAETRLDILRKVFGIDKYKRIKENAKIYSSHLKSKKKEYNALLENFDEKSGKLKDKNKLIKEVQNKIDLLKPKINSLNNEIKEKKNSIKEFEGKIKSLIELKNKLSIKDVELKNKLREIEHINENVKEFDDFINELVKELKEYSATDVKDIKELIPLKEKEVKFMEDTLREIDNKLNEAKIRKENSERVINDINDLDICPTCKQKVGKEHKHSILGDEKKNLEQYNEYIKNYSKSLNDAEEKLKTAKEAMDKLKRAEYETNLIKLKESTLEEKKKNKERYLAQLKEAKTEIGRINNDKSKIFNEIDKLRDVESNYEKLKLELDKLNNSERQLEIEAVGLEKDLANLNSEAKELKKDIEKNLVIKERLEKINKLHHWLDEHFLNLMDVIEKNILLRVHTDFDDLFKKWFNIIIDNGMISVKLDTDFSPLIEQDGHDIAYEYLSGGEKTAAALAYRLALNQVINNLSNINTKDLVILDEPTDGFSSEQLDRIRLVLDELKIKQIIIVSHDPKIESFVDSVIRLNKNGHVTEVV